MDRPIRPQGLWRGRFKWGMVHYGLVFEQVPAAYRVRCALGARLEGLPVHRGYVERWWLVRIRGRNVLFLPRRWLIASGNLSPLAALVPWLRFPLDPHVLEAFWLESKESP
jgi:hypothetical protein